MSHYYAVRKGRTNRIIVQTWKECSDLVTGYSGAEFKKFDSKEKAEEFISAKRKFDAITSQEECVALDAKRFKSDITLWTVVYTDGFCKDNDVKTTAREAGLGVYFPHNNLRISKRLPIDPEHVNTNNKAELLAIKEALLIASDDLNLDIRTDSMYAINVFTNWLREWKMDPKKLAKKKNLPLIYDIEKLIESRAGRVKWTHCKAHNGIAGNEIADKLAENLVD